MEEVANMPSNSQEFCLRWNNFHSSLVSALDGFKNDLDFVDVTLACEGQFLKAHKMLLSACSVFFRDLLKANPCQHPIVILPPEVRFIDLEKMLRFIYQGEVNVQQENLARFLKTAEMLKIRGLAEDNDKQKVLEASSPRPPENCSGGGGGSERGNESSAISPKRPRLSIDLQSGSITEHPQTPNDENSRLSGADSDSEMIPVKQEMIELKECDFENADNDFLTDTYLRDSTSGTSSNVTSNSQQLPTHPAAPPPPGPLLPSYVPPPQIKAQDDSPLGTSHEDLSQGTFASLVADHYGVKHEVGGEEDEELSREEKPILWSAGKNSSSCFTTPLSSLSSSSSVRSRGSPSSMTSSSGKLLQRSPKSAPGSRSTSPLNNSSFRGKISPANCKSEGQKISPGREKSSNFTPPPLSGSPPAATASSLSIWHPPRDKSSVPTSVDKDHSPVMNSAAALPFAQAASSSLSNATSSSIIIVSGFTCDTCLKTFTSRSNLNKHKRVQHSGEEYICPYCNRTFTNRYYIKDHVNLCSHPLKKSFNSPCLTSISSNEYYHVDEIEMGSDSDQA